MLREDGERPADKWPRREEGGGPGGAPSPGHAPLRYDTPPLSPPSVTFGTIQASDLSSTEEELLSLKMQSKKHPELRSQVPLTVQKPHGCSKDK